MKSRQALKGRESGMWVLMAWGFFWGDEVFRNQIVVMVVQLCEYTKDH